MREWTIEKSEFGNYWIMCIYFANGLISIKTFPTATAACKWLEEH